MLSPKAAYFCVFISILFLLFGIPLRASSAAPAVPAAAEDESRLIRVGYFSDNVFHIGQSDYAPKKGYGYEYYRMVSNYTGWEYRYFYGTWSEVYNAFLEGKIDIIDDVSITEERKALMDFSSLPMGEEHFYIFVPQNRFDISLADPSSLNGKRIGANENSLNMLLLQKFIAENNLSCEAVPCKGYDDRLNKMKTGEIDGMVTTDGFTMAGFRPTFSVGSSNFYFGVRKDRPDLLEKLNRAMIHHHEINPNYNNQLRDKYYKKSIMRTVFTTEEAQYLEMHPVLRIGYIKDCLPYADTDSKTGLMTGLISDIIKDFEKIMGIRFETTGFETSTEMVSALKMGEIDCAYPVMDHVWLSEQQGYTQTTPITSERMSLIYKGQYEGLSAYKKFAYTEGSPEQLAYLMEHNLGARFRYRNMADALEAIRSGEADAMVVNAMIWSHYTRTHDKCDDLNSVMLEENVGYSMAVPKNGIRLYSLFEAALSQLNEAMTSESLNRHSHGQENYSLLSFIKHNLNFCIVLLFGISASIVAGIAVYEKNKAHKAYLIYNAEHDALTGVYNRSVLGRLEQNTDNRKICMLMVDIDDFKNINDRYGHETGDSIIRKVAALLKSTVRTSDTVIRFGGDEFMVIMNDADITKKETITRKIAAINEKLQEGSDGLPLTSISIGIAFSEKGYCTAVFDKADEALYKSKSVGKHTFTVNEKPVPLI